jgi:hypothetical protein
MSDETKLASWITNPNEAVQELIDVAKRARAHGVQLPTPPGCHPYEFTTVEQWVQDWAGNGPLDNLKTRVKEAEIARAIPDHFQFNNTGYRRPDEWTLLELIRFWQAFVDNETLITMLQKYPSEAKMAAQINEIHETRRTAARQSIPA